MTLSVNSKPVSYPQAHIDELLVQINVTHQPLAITENGETTAILQDPESYQSLQNAISLLRLIAHAEQDIRLERTMAGKELETEMLELLSGPDKESQLFCIWSGRDNIESVDDYIRLPRFSGGVK